MRYTIPMIILCVFTTQLACVSPDAAKVEVAGANVLNKLEKVADAMENTLNIHSTTNNSGVINSSLGWIGMTAAVILCFGVVSWVIVKMILSHLRLSQSLKLVTTSVENLPADVKSKVKKQIKHETENGGPFSTKHRRHLEVMVEKILKPKTK